MKLTGILVDVKNETAGIVTIERTLQEYYKILDCNCIDIPTLKIGNRYYNIVCDDEALLKGNPKISAINDMGQAMLCGNLFIVKDDVEGDLKSLSEDDQNWIMQFISLQATTKYKKAYPMLHQVDY